MGQDYFCPVRTLDLSCWPSDASFFRQSWSCSCLLRRIWAVVGRRHWKLVSQGCLGRRMIGCLRGRLIERHRHVRNLAAKSAWAGTHLRYSSTDRLQSLESAWAIESTGKRWRSSVSACRSPYWSSFFLLQCCCCTQVHGLDSIIN